MATKNTRKVVSPKEIKRLDQSTIDIVQGLNFLILKANNGNLPTIIRILEDAREKIALWTAQNDYNDSATEKMVHALSLTGGMQIALNALAKIANVKDETIRKELLQAFKELKIKSVFILTFLQMNFA